MSTVVTFAQSIEIKWNAAALVDKVVELGYERGFESKHTIQLSGGYYSETSKVIPITGFKAEFQYRFYKKDSKDSNYFVNTTEDKATHAYKKESKNRAFGINLFHVNNGFFWAPFVNAYTFESEREKHNSYGAGAIAGYKIHRKRLFIEITGGAGYYLGSEDAPIYNKGVHPIYALSVGAVL